MHTQHQPCQYFSSLIYTCTLILLYKSIFLQKGEIMLKQNRRRFACPKRAKDFALKKLLYISSIPTFLKTHLNIPWIYRITKKPPDFRRPDFPANYPYIFSIVSQFRQTGDLIFFYQDASPRSSILFRGCILRRISACILAAT